MHCCSWFRQLDVLKNWRRVDYCRRPYDSSATHCVLLMLSLVVLGLRGAAAMLQVLVLRPAPAVSLRHSVSGCCTSWLSICARCQTLCAHKTCTRRSQAPSSAFLQYLLVMMDASNASPELVQPLPLLNLRRVCEVPATRAWAQRCTACQRTSSCLCQTPTHYAGYSL